MTARTDTAAPRPSLAHLPLAYFSAGMGLGGLAAAWRAAERGLGASHLVGDFLVSVAAMAVLALVALSAARAVRHRAAVVAELTNPVAVAFSSTASIALMVVAIPLETVSGALAAGFWWVGAALHLAATPLTVRLWIGSPATGLGSIHPGWFIPAVGNIVAPIAGVHWAPDALLWYFFAVGMFFWMALTPLVLLRLLTGDALPSRLAPSLAILVAPPAVAATAWVALAGRWGDGVTTVLVALTAFQLALLATQVREIAAAPFAPSAWATTFPTAAAAVALLRFGDGADSALATWAGIAVLAAATFVVGVAFARTLVAGAQRRIGLPEQSPVAAPKN